MAFTLQTLREQAAAGEDSTRQFKSRIDNADSLAAEMAAFANANGGVIFIGVQDDGTLSGITSRELHDANQLIGNAAPASMSAARLWCRRRTFFLKMEMWLSP